ncbi:MAG TPA: type IV secretory system conjugative DNA transfer family protein [Xanthobacteraceae bacterium]|jgi:type IV secretion system protein VirD4|nr:type IV secretory system conjugative DNA transfer family protein [Xanthobacteraceae bacterium]
MHWFGNRERERWATSIEQSPLQERTGLPALDNRSRDLYERGLPRGVTVPRLTEDRPPFNEWMAPGEVLRRRYQSGQVILGKLGGQFLGHLDDRPLITIAGARAGKTSTVLEPNLYLYPGSMLVLDPKGELAQTAPLRRALGHNVHVLDPFGQSLVASSSFNTLAEIDLNNRTVVDDVASITQALIVDDGDTRSKHWNDSARTLLKGIILLTLTLPEHERNFVTVRELLSLTSPHILRAVKSAITKAKREKPDEQYYDENRLAVQTLLKTMSRAGDRFGGILAAIGNRFLGTPQTERGSVFSTASTQTDFLDSIPLREISKHSDFKLADLRNGRPTTIFLCLPVGRMESHYRWLRLIVQMACTVLERLGTYPRDRAPILFMMEEFATLGNMEIMERAAAYFPGFGVKLWVILQDMTQLERYYKSSAETFIGNAGLIQCFANNDQATLEYVSRRLAHLIEPFELRTAFSRERLSQLLMFEGEKPVAAMRMDHSDVEMIRRLAEGHSRGMASTGPIALLPPLIAE